MLPDPAQSHRITWRQHSDLVIEPDVRSMEWDAFNSAMQLLKAGEEAARQALPRIQAWAGLPQMQLTG
jgi:predicted acylesterase/phospholipase RssA